MRDNVYLPEINKAGGWGTSEHGVEMFQKMRNHKGSLSTEREQRERERERERARAREKQKERERERKRKRDKNISGRKNDDTKIPDVM